MANSDKEDLDDNRRDSHVSGIDKRLTQLEKTLNIELKVKEGAEKLIQTYSSGSSRDKKLLAEAQLMLSDAKVKIEYITMLIAKVKQKQSLEIANHNNGPNFCENNSNKSDKNKLSEVISSLEMRIEELRHRLRVECAMVDGAKNVIKLLQSSKMADRKALQEAQTNLFESSQKVDILRKALEICRQQLPQGSPKSALLKKDLDNSHSVTPAVYSPTIKDTYKIKDDLAPSSPAVFSKPAAVTGKLEVRLIGCQGLLEDVPGRSPRNSSSPADLKSLVRATSKGLSLSSSRSYCVKDETSNEIMAILKLDNVNVGQTTWKACSQMAWDMRFSLDLDRSKELEIQIYWHDWRSLCALKFLRVEEFIDDVRHGMAIHLEPQGILFAEIKFLDPMISRRPKLQRQKLFRLKNKNILRPNLMNINVATWGRLLKRAFPQASADQSLTSSSYSSANLNLRPSDAGLANLSLSENDQRKFSEESNNKLDDNLQKPNNSLDVSEISTALQDFEFIENSKSEDNSNVIITTPQSKEPTPTPNSNESTPRPSVYSLTESDILGIQSRYSPGPEPVIDLPDDDTVAAKNNQSMTANMTLDQFEFISVLGRGHFGKVI